MTKIETVFWQDQITGLCDESLADMMDNWFHEIPSDWVLELRSLIESEWQRRATPALAA